MIATIKPNPSQPEALGPYQGPEHANPHQDFLDFWRNPNIGSIDFEARFPEVVGQMPEEERLTFTSGSYERPGYGVRSLRLTCRDELSRGVPPILDCLPTTQRLIREDLERIGMKPTLYWDTYRSDSLKDGQPLIAGGASRLHTDGDNKPYRQAYRGSLDELPSKPPQANRLALYLVTDCMPTEFYVGTARITKGPTELNYNDYFNYTSCKVTPLKPSPENIITGVPGTIYRMDNLTLHRSPTYSRQTAGPGGQSDRPETDSSAREHPRARTLMRIWCQEYVNLEESDGGDPKPDGHVTHALGAVAAPRALASF